MPFKRLKTEYLRISMTSLKNFKGYNFSILIYGVLKLKL